MPQRKQVRVPRVIVFGPMPFGGARALARLKLTSRDEVIAVDGGLAACAKLGIVPGLAIGDWDSLPRAKARQLLTGVPHLTLPSEKDQSDLHYALCAALDFEPEEIVALGFTGGRPDHHQASLIELAAVSELCPVRASGEDGEYVFLSGARRQWKGKGLKRGSLVSVFAMDSVADGVTLEGFQYSLKSARFEPSSQGLSNIVTSTNPEVRVRSGRLMLIFPA